jgi:hypothetical protein
LIASMVQFSRPRSVLEIGMGYTTPFIAGRSGRRPPGTSPRKSVALAAKTRPYIDGDNALDDAWTEAEPALLTPSFYTTAYRPVFVAVDDLSLPDSVGRPGR